MLMNRADVFLEDDLLRRGGTDHFGEPPQVGRAPGGSTCIADIMAKQKGVETELGGLKIAEGIFTSPAEVADGFVFHRRDFDGGEVT